MIPPDAQCVGSLDEFRTDRATAVCDGSAVVVRRGEEVSAFINRCAHLDRTLADGAVSEGVLMCPHHFWRFDAATGEVVGSGSTEAGRPASPSACLERLDVEINDGVVHVFPPAIPEPLSIREMMLEHARTWDRDAGPAGR